MKLPYRLINCYVDAVQWFEMGDHPLVTQHPCRSNAGQLLTSEGILCQVNPGDWIVEGANGTILTYKDEDFKSLYVSLSEENDE